MQVHFSALPATLSNIELALSQPRLARYVDAAGGDRQKGLRLYVWNGQLSQSLHLSLHIVEVIIRNAISNMLERNYGQNWYNDTKFIRNINGETDHILKGVIKRQSKLMKSSLNNGMIIADLSFGFWCILLTQRYLCHLWNKRNLISTFPYFSHTGNHKSDLGSIHILVEDSGTELRIMSLYLIEIF
jgi:hypothetical protein